MLMRRLLMMGAVVMGLLIAGDVMADAVPGPPAFCPKGAVPRTGHAGPYCGVASCTKKCSLKGGKCKQLALCIHKKKGSSRGGPFTVNEVIGLCDSKGKCGKGSCTLTKVCVKPGGCSKVAGSSLPLSMLMCGVFLVFVRVRRRATL